MQSSVGRCAWAPGRTVPRQGGGLLPPSVLAGTVLPMHVPLAPKCFAPTRVGRPLGPYPWGSDAPSGFRFQCSLALASACCPLFGSDAVALCGSAYAVSPSRFLVLGAGPFVDAAIRSGDQRCTRVLNIGTVLPPCWRAGRPCGCRTCRLGPGAHCYSSPWWRLG